MNGAARRGKQRRTRVNAFMMMFIPLLLVRWGIVVRGKGEK